MIKREARMEGGMCPYTSPFDGNSIHVWGSGGDGLVPKAPKASYDLWIWITPDGASVSIEPTLTTPYPSLEVWMYGGPTGNPVLIYYYDEGNHGPSDLR